MIETGPRRCQCICNIFRRNFPLRFLNRTEFCGFVGASARARGCNSSIAVEFYVVFFVFRSILWVRVYGIFDADGGNWYCYDCFSFEPCFFLRLLLSQPTSGSLFPCLQYIFRCYSLNPRFVYSRTHCIYIRCCLCTSFFPYTWDRWLKEYFSFSGWIRFWYRSHSVACSHWFISLGSYKVLRSSMRCSILVQCCLGRHFLCWLQFCAWACLDFTWNRLIR